MNSIARKEGRKEGSFDRTIIYQWKKGRTDGSSWNSGSPKTIKKIGFNTLRDSVITVIDDVYIREDTGKSWKSREKILDVGLAGEKFKVLEVYESPAKTGGPFIWAKVREINS